MPKMPLKHTEAKGKEVQLDKLVPESRLDSLAQVESDDARCAIGVGSFVFLIYLSTAYRTLAGGDSGDMVASSCSLGVAHPPGYPLHTLLGALFLRIVPFGSPAFRVNLVSVIAGATAAAQIFRAALILVRMLPQHPRRKITAAMARWASAVGALMFAFMPLAWTYSTHAEVFALNNLLIASLLLFTLRFSLTRQPNEATSAALAIGLGFANQHTFVFYAVPAVAWALVWIISSKKLCNFTVFMHLAAWGLAGMLPYAFMVWAGTRKIKDSWGETGTWTGFWRHFLRQEYGTFKLYPGADQARNNMFEVL